MDDIYANIATDVERTLLWLGNRLIQFTIGKTADPNYRECHYQNLSYTHFCEICKGEPDFINKGEKYLIDYFKNHSTLKELQNNEREGGAGNPEASVLYVAIKNKESNIDDIDGNILPANYPLDYRKKRTNKQ